MADTRLSSTPNLAVPPNPHSTLEVAGHPIHPMLIVFPVAFLAATLVVDCIYWGTGNDGWASAAVWLVGAGTVSGALAAVAGLTDFLGERRIRDLSASWQHFLGNAAVILISAFNWYWHLQGADHIAPGSIILSAVVVGILLFTGWKGWEMVYRDHVGISDMPHFGHR